MLLVAGSRLDSYEIIAPLGAGGMGEVYRARDTLLKRDVAIKVLRDSRSTDPEHLLRFELEAQATAEGRCVRIARQIATDLRLLWFSFDR
jgi:serine/threonine protein kinase